MCLAKFPSATSMMIPHLQIVPGPNHIDLNWPPPLYTPNYYEAWTSCTFANEKAELSSFAQPTSLDLRIINLHPGSICEVIFRAVYNQASLDSGIKQTVTLLPAGKECFYVHLRYIGLSLLIKIFQFMITTFYYV